jgi:hypothetical protein
MDWTAARQFISHPIAYFSLTKNTYLARACSLVAGGTAARPRKKVPCYFGVLHPALGTFVLFGA